MQQFSSSSSSNPSSDLNSHGHSHDGCCDHDQASQEKREVTIFDAIKAGYVSKCAVFMVTKTKSCPKILTALIHEKGCWMQPVPVEGCFLLS